MITPYRVKPELSTLLVQFFGGNRSESSVVEDVCGGKGCVTGLVPENLSQPLPPELLRRLQKGTTLAARFPSTKPST